MKPNVLIVDDSLTVRMDLSQAFEAAGFAPAMCGTLAAAREALARGSFALVVLDVMLPDGDGIAFLREIKSHAATAVPVMLLSSEAEVKDRVRGLQTGADEYVGKPYDLTYVVARAGELVPRAPAVGSVNGAPTVLVVDDSATFREEMRSALQAAGYAVLTAATGEEGLRTALTGRPDAVVVDGMLPGIDGATVVRRLKQDAVLRHTPCLLLTASEERAHEVEAFDAGADAYIRKGEDVEVILARLAGRLRAVAGSPSGADSAASLLGPKRILAVDDSLTHLHRLADQLRQDGYDVVLARSGEEALELLAVQPVDCILMDLVMPGMSGHEACRRIKSSPALRDIPLMMLTALEEREAMIEGINAGADDYIAKSSEFDVLRARLRAQLRRKQFEDENRHFRDQLVQKELEAAEERAARELAETRAALLADLEEKNQELQSANRELEAFSYSVSHDLRAPLRAIDGFSQVLLDVSSERLDEEGKECLQRVRAAAQRMAELIDDLLHLSRVGRGELQKTDVDLSALARQVATQLLAAQPERDVELVIAEGVVAQADERLLRAALENLIGNALKFTSKRGRPRIEFGVTEEDGRSVYFVRDNGAGFDMNHAAKLFRPFQRLHRATQFEGTGIGLATVQRIINRHGGRIWAEAAVGQGATFYFTL